MYFKGKKILIAGGTSFIGVNLMRRLMEFEADIYATLHKSSPVLTYDEIKYIEDCDLRCPDICKHVVKGMDYVIMCAANTSGAAMMEKNPLIHVTPNVIMNTCMLEAAYEANVEKFLFISSNTVYPVTDYPVTEDEMLNGDLYEKYFCVGWMKRFSEVLCEMYGSKIQNPMTTIVVRPANSYGIDDDFDFETSHVIPALIRKFVEKHDPIEVWGDGKDIKDFIYIDDLVEGILHALNFISSFDCVNIASGQQSTVSDVVNMLTEITDYDGDIRYDTSKPTMLPIRLISTEKAEELIGFKAQTSLYQGLSKTVEWYSNKVSQ